MTMTKHPRDKAKTIRITLGFLILRVSGSHREAEPNPARVQANYTVFVESTSPAVGASIRLAARPLPLLIFLDILACRVRRRQR